MTESSAVEFPAIPYPWQQGEWQHLQEQHSAKKLPHALIFAGQRGIGKRHLVQALGQFLLCLTPRSGLPCGECRGCELNRAETHPDIHLLEPEEAGKAIKVDQVRAITDFVSKTSQQGGYKVVIIDPAEAMNINASNALLKSLEEPSGDTVLLLVSHVPSAVMATIRSRCQLLSLAAPLRRQALPWLENLVSGNADAEALLDFANGAPLDALAMLQGDALEQRAALLRDIEAVSLGQLSPLEAAGKWMAYAPSEVLEWLLKWLHGLSRFLGTGHQVRGRDIPASLENLLAGIQQPHLYRYVDKVMSAKRQLQSGANPNKQLLLEELLMDWSALTRLAAGSGQPRRNGLSW